MIHRYMWHENVALFRLSEEPVLSPANVQLQNVPASEVPRGKRGRYDRNVTPDRFFTSVLLAEDLAGDRLTVVGTNKSRKITSYQQNAFFSATDDRARGRPSKNLFVFTIYLTTNLVSHLACQSCRRGRGASPVW